MTTYSVDVYGKNAYGQPLYTAFDTGFMRADPIDYGQLQISWGTPLQTTTSAIISGTQSWTLLRLVRNSYGVPDSEDDGLVCLEVTASGTQNSYVDTTVRPGRFYYYAIFVAVPLALWSSTAIYQPGNVITYSSVSYQCLVANTTATVPGTDASVWAVVSLTATWTRCGGVVGLPAKDEGLGPVMYDLVPRPYKVARVESTASSIEVNAQLYKFLQMFGYHLDIMKNENDAQLLMNSVLRCTDAQLSLMANEMGISDRMPGLPELRRTYVRDAVEIQRGKGTPAALSTLIKALSGWDALVQIGYNQLHDLDEAAFASPVYPAWDASAVYRTDPTLSTGDRVTYNGGLYEARGAVIRNSAYLLNHSARVTSSAGGGVLTDGWSQNSTYRYYLDAEPLASGDTVTVNFDTPAMGAGYYNIALGFIGDPYSGTFDVRVVYLNQILDLDTDLYAPEYDTVIRRGYGKVNLQAGTNSVIFTVGSANAFSRGNALGLDYIELTPYTTPSGVRPTGDTASSQYWTSLTIGPVTSAIAAPYNPTTRGFSTWNMVTTAGTVNPVTTTAVPPPTATQWWVAPLSAGVGTASPGAGNSLAYSNPTGASVGPLQIMTCGWPQAADWYYRSESGAGNVVIYPSGSGQVWRSNSAPHYAKPGVDFGWDLTPMVNGVNLTKPEPWLVQRQAVPIRRLPSWRADVAYNTKDQVAWVGHRYEAALPVQGTTPSGSGLDTHYWRWLGPNVQEYTFSIYHYRTATGTGQNVRPYITWFDAYGNVLATAQVQNSQQLLYDRFESDEAAFPYGGTPGTWVTPVAWQQGTGIPWSQNWGTWTTTQGLVYPVPGAWTTPSGTTTATALSIQQAGMALCFSRSAVNAGSSGEQVYVTFVSSPLDATALGTLEHGIAFRYSNGGGYWLASRDRLTYMANATNGTPNAFPSPGQTPTVVASWASIPDHTRMRVTNTTTTVKVEVMYPTGPGIWYTLANVSDSTHYQTNVGYGLIERVRQ